MAYTEVCPKNTLKKNTVTYNTLPTKALQDTPLIAQVSGVRKAVTLGIVL